MNERASHQNSGFSNRWRFGLALTAAIAFLVIAIVPEAKARSATEACVYNVANGFLNAARSGSHRAFRNVLNRHVDVHQIALFALGQYRRSLPSNRTSEYVGLVRDFIAHLLADNHRKFNAVDIRINRSYPQGNMTVVESTLLFVGGRNDERVSWRLTRPGRNCKVFDVNVQNVWLAGQLRSTLAAEIRRNNGNVNAVFDYLRSGQAGA